MRVKTRTFIQIIVVAVIIATAIYLKGKGEKRDTLINEKGRYTIGETTGSSSNWLRSSTKGLNYTYNVAGISYRGVRQLKSLRGIKTSAGLYIVKFLPENPTKSLILVDKPVIFKSIVPDSGWKEIPDYVIYLRK